MTDEAYSTPVGRADRAGETSGWAVGLILFAAIMMITVGIFQALDGLIALFDDSLYTQVREYSFQFDATWGWIHLIGGVIVAFAGWGLLSGQTWARGSRSPRPCPAPSPTPVAPLLPVLGDADHHPGRLRDLGGRRPRPRAAGHRGLTDSVRGGEP